MAITRILLIALAFGALTSVAGRTGEAPLISVSSAAFSEGGTVPKEYTCEGQDKSPPLSWSGVPAGAKTLALIVDDPDAPSGPFTHWIVYNLPGKISALPENLPKTRSVANGGIQAMNDFGRVGYNGPCPPGGSPHHYHFRLYALTTELHLANDAGARELSEAMRGHVLSSGETVGLFAR
jgi:Raf kinase inhibitor-like YbhB/YbcL family protein